MDETITRERGDDGIDRRGFLECMAWAGAGVLVTLFGGVARSATLAEALTLRTGGDNGDFSFAQISDSHIGFSKAANPDVAGTLEEAVQRIRGLEAPPDFVLHTGDISHLSKASEFDTADQILRATGMPHVHYVPGEHDVLDGRGKSYRDRYARRARGDGWYSFDHKGCHFIGLVNVMDLKPGGMGALGPDQLAWLRSDLSDRSGSTPVVVFAHVPLWSVYPEWGWGTDDGAEALSYLRRFGSVTVLNGHVHQTMQKVEGNVTFHTAASTAFPQPKPGEAAGPGPMTVPAERLRQVLGITSVQVRRTDHSLAVMDQSLEAPAAATAHQVTISGFRFGPRELAVSGGTTVTWINQDDMPHTVVSVAREFRSPVLDSGDRFAHRFEHGGPFEYYCSLHPGMTGRVVVRG